MFENSGLRVSPHGGVQLASGGASCAVYNRGDEIIAHICGPTALTSVTRANLFIAAMELLEACDDVAFNVLDEQIAQMRRSAIEAMALRAMTLQSRIDEHDDLKMRQARYDAAMQFEGDQYDGPPADTRQ